MWKFLACVAIALAGAAAIPTPAHAQPSIDAKLAEELAQQAFDAYSKGEYIQAISLYKKAYQASSAGVILFNIANIYDKKVKDKDQALDYYRRYLRSGDTEPELVKRASERLDIVRAEIEATRAAQQEERAASIVTSQPPGSAPLPAQPPPPPPQPWTRMQKIGLGTGAAGIVGLGVSGIYGYRAKSKNDDVARVCTDRTCPDNIGIGDHDAAKRFATISTVSFVAGAALVTAGVVLYIYGPSKKEDTKMNKTTTVGIIPQPDGLALTGSW